MNAHVIALFQVRRQHGVTTNATKPLVTGMFVARTWHAGRQYASVMASTTR